MAIVPIHDSTPVGTFCQQLAESLSPFGPTLHLTSARLDRHLGRPGIAQTYERDGRNAHVVGWLAKQESEYRHVLYEADPFLSPWTERCIRQADQIILVGQGTDDPALGEIETQLLDSGGQRLSRSSVAHPRSRSRRAVRYQSLARPPKGGSPLSRETRRRERPSSRIARLLTGRAVGLTLGGGFARGLAHVGVFQAFEELGLPIDVDRVGEHGSDARGSVGDGLGPGSDDARGLRRLRQSFRRLDVSRSWRSSAAGNSAGTSGSLFGDVQIEDSVGRPSSARRPT